MLLAGVSDACRLCFIFSARGGGSVDEIIKDAGELVLSAAAAGGPLAVGVKTLVNAGGLVLKEGGKVALGFLINHVMEDLFRRYGEAKDKGDVPEDFEATPHGAALLQEALNALLEGLDQERAEAVKRVFLGLAMNPVEDSLERVQQLEIMKVASQLTTWEVVLINALERFRKEVFVKALGDEWEEAASDPSRRNLVVQRARQQASDLADWLRKSFCQGDVAYRHNLNAAIQSLDGKHILTNGLSGLRDLSKRCVFLKTGAFTEFGWKLAVHLYSATEE